jgi:hypothetical protein
LIVRLAGTAVPEVLEGENLTSLEVVLAEPASLPDNLGSLGRVDPDGQHVWLIIDALRVAADPGRDPTWEDRFNGMVAYARSKGWVDADGKALRAHIVRSD